MATEPFAKALRQRPIESSGGGCDVHDALLSLHKLEVLRVLTLKQFVASTSQCRFQCIGGLVQTAHFKQTLAESQAQIRIGVTFRACGRFQ